MFQIKHLDHLVLRVTDLQAMMKFYIDVLGCSVEKVQEELGLYQLRAGTALIDLVPIDGPLGRKGGAAPGPEARNLDHFCYASIRTTPMRSSRTCNGMASRPGRFRRVTARRVKGRRFTPRIPRVIRWS
jgi:catechol 2,3-dioxygenase-like lactoylglutathione lyase family enzyme